MAPTSTHSRTITLDDLTHQNIGILKKLNTVLFPVPYSEKFYKESLTVGELAKLGNLHPQRDRVVLSRLWTETDDSVFQRRVCWGGEMSV